MSATIQDAMSAMLEALGFAAMAEEVKTEADLDRLRRYARVIVKNISNGEKRAEAMRLFRLHKPPMI